MTIPTSPSKGITRQQLRRWISFTGTGVLSVGVHFALMAGLIRLSVDPIIATASGAFAGALVNYVLHYHVTFQASAGHTRNLPIFAITALAGWTLNNLMFAGLHHQLALAVIPAQGITSITIALMNYGLYKWVVFR